MSTTEPSVNFDLTDRFSSAILPVQIEYHFRWQNPSFKEKVEVFACNEHVCTVDQVGTLSLQGNVPCPSEVSKLARQWAGWTSNQQSAVSCQPEQEPTAEERPPSPKVAFEKVIDGHKCSADSHGIYVDGCRIINNQTGHVCRTSLIYDVKMALLVLEEYKERVEQEKRTAEERPLTPMSPEAWTVLQESIRSAQEKPLVNRPSYAKYADGSQRPSLSQPEICFPVEKSRLLEQAALILEQEGWLLRRLIHEGNTSGRIKAFAERCSAWEDEVKLLRSFNPNFWPAPSDNS